MGKTLLIAIVGCFLFLAPNDACAQDPLFTQFYATTLYTNPAMAGTAQFNRGGGRAVLNYRNQWPSLPGTYVTSTISYDQHFDKIKGGLGLLVLRDIAGEGLLTSTHAGATYSHHVSLNDDVYMRFGVEGQIMQRALDWSRLFWGDQIDATRGFVASTLEPSGPSAITSLNVNAGWLIYAKSFYGGIAVHNVSQPVQSFYGDPDAKLPRRYTVHAGYAPPLVRDQSADSIGLRPNVLLMKQGGFTQFNASCYFNLNWLIAGVGVRLVNKQLSDFESYLGSIGYRGKRFRMAYSYDLTLDERRSTTRGSHEVSIAYQWCSKKDSKKLRSDECLAFW